VIPFHHKEMEEYSNITKINIRYIYTKVEENSQWNLSRSYIYLMSHGEI
jgi:hypothetical protein